MTNKEFFLKTWNNEMASTMSAINGLPDNMESLNYKSDEKARSAAAILGHILNHAEEMCNACEKFIIEEKSTHKQFNSKQEIASFFEKHARLLTDKLNAVDDKTWESKLIEFKFDGNKLFAYPMSDTYWILIFDIIHHRGQLSTYYRHMGVRSPQIYGPTADDIK